jgi:hypothetical protein
MKWMTCQNTYFGDRGVNDNRYWGHGRNIFANMVMKGECPNQGRHGLLCAQEKRYDQLRWKNCMLLAGICSVFYTITK